MSESLVLPPWLAWSVLVLSATVLSLLVPFALHRTFLLVLARKDRPEFEKWEDELPLVTVQLPVYNEAAVVERLIDAAASLAYPRDRLEIQVLDDSDDLTVTRVAERARYWTDRGVQISHLRRGSREGFKAGALAFGLERARGEFVLILDADFVPPRRLIHDLLGPFRDPEVGMSQARWDHLNEGASILTRSQALLLDAHFFFEQGGRWASGRFMNFNGTAGMWRRTALDEAGGWSADTLTEDLDVSYRAQMAGWRFAFRPRVGVPAELPGVVPDFELQQKRWAQGGVQTARKLLPTLLRGPWSWRIKSEGVVHLLGHLAHPLTVLLGILLVPSALARSSLGLERFLALDLFIFAGATLSFLLFYCAAGRRRGRPWLALIPTALATLTVGIGLGPAVSRAVGRGIRGGSRDPFRRTPKRGTGRTHYPSSRAPGDTALKIGLTLWMLAGGLVALQQGLYATLPFVLLFGAGYAGMALGDLRRPAGGGDVKSRELGDVMPADCSPVATT